MKGKDIDNLENILLDLEDVENGAMISLSQEEINSLESILETLKSSISKDKIIEWIDRFELEEDLQDKYDELLGSEAIYKFLNELLEENNEKSNTL